MEIIVRILMKERLMRAPVERAAGCGIQRIDAPERQGARLC
jgi:hypothetical protein